MSVRRIRRLLAERGRDFFTNWREYDAPLPTKLGLTLRNRVRALFSRAQCCGHAGQPGC
ncbi:MAG TPA: hypothetical protein VF029_04870 [Actinomycetota bacterium]